MKLSIIIYSCLLTILTHAQDTNYIKNLPLRYPSNSVPDSNFTTVSADTTISGRILDFCSPVYFHYIGNSIGVIKLESNDKIYQILYFYIDQENLNEIDLYSFGTVNVRPYSSTDPELEKSNGTTCSAIVKQNICILNDIKKVVDTK